MPTISLLPSHSQPHAAPLCMIHGLDNAWYLVDERDGTRDVIEDGDLANLLPRVRNVLQQFHDSMRNVLQRAEVHSLVVPELAVAHVSVVFNDFADMFRREILDMRQPDVPPVNA